MDVMAESRSVYEQASRYLDKKMLLMAVSRYTALNKLYEAQYLILGAMQGSQADKTYANGCRNGLIEIERMISKLERRISSIEERR